MTDLVERLRIAAIEIAAENHYGWGNTCTDAADEIERLRAQVETLDWQLAMESIDTTCHCAAKSAADCGCPGAVWPEDSLRAENGRLRALLREARDIAADPYTAEYVLTAILARIDAAIKEQP